MTKSGVASRASTPTDAALGSDPLSSSHYFLSDFLLFSERDRRRATFPGFSSAIRRDQLSMKRCCGGRTLLPPRTTSSQSASGLLGRSPAASRLAHSPSSARYASIKSSSSVPNASRRRSATSRL